MNFPALGWLAAVPAWLFRWSLLLALGWMMHGLLRRRHARWRLILWRTVLCSSIGLPLLQLIKLPAVAIDASALVPIAESAEPPEPPTPRPRTFQSSLDSNSHSVHAQASPVLPRRATAFKFLRIAPGEGLLLAWLLGAACAGLRLSRVSRQLARVRRDALPASPALQEAADQIRRQLGVGLPVLIQYSDRVASPFVCGIFRPAIILPRGLRLDTAERTVLLRHELAHLPRHDVAWNLAWRWMKVLGWFHPLVWPVPRAHSLAAEQEADRMASGALENPSAYAQVLASLALRVAGLPSAQSELALHATSHLVRRLQHLTTGNVGPWTKRQSIMAYTLSALLLLIAGGWTLSQSKAAEAMAAAARSYRDLLITVEDENHQPVEGATLQPYAFRVKGPKWVDAYGWDRSARPKLVTDAQGQVRLRYPVEAFPAEKLLTGQISVTVAHPAFGPITAELPIDGTAQPIRLIRGMVLVVTGVADGQPVRQLVANLSGDPRVDWGKNDPLHQILTCRQVSPGGHVLQLMGRLPSGEMVYSEGIAFTAERGDRDTLRTGDAAVSAEKGKPMDLTVGMRPGIRLEGRLDARVPRPVREGRVIIGVRPKQFPAYVVPEVGADLYRQFGRLEFWSSYRAIAEDGSFVFESIPQGEVDVVVHGEGFVSKNGGHPYNPGVGANSPLVIGVPQAFSLREPVTKIEVVTEPTATLEVTVKTKSGEPVRGATVSTWPNVMRMQAGILGGIHRSSEMAFGPVEPLSKMPSAYSGSTDAAGKVVLRDIPSVATFLGIEHPEYEVPLPKVNSGAGDRYVRFKLTPGKIQALAVTMQPKGTDHIGTAK